MPIKEENLVPYSDIIKPGQRLQKIGNTFMPVGIGGAFEPAGIKMREIGYDSLYECASVGESTWSGYKLVLTDGFYGKAETLTEGLTFGTGYTPEVGTVYNADATIEVGKYSKHEIVPSDGLVFYAPLAKDTTDTIQGIEAGLSGSSITSYDGLNCLSTTGLNGDHPVLYQFNDKRPGITGDNFSLFCCVSWLGNVQGDYLYGIGHYWGGVNLKSAFFRLNGSNLVLSLSSADYVFDNVSLDKSSAIPWCSICCTKDSSGNLCLYYNGVVNKTATGVNSEIADYYFVLSGFLEPSYKSYGLQFAHACIYNRALTSDEVMKMHNRIFAEA